jgi:glycosyltransferase involved in cell wall biosynthesis
MTVLSQEPRPGQYDLGGARHVRPTIEGPLPVFVLDRYEGHEPRLLQDLTRQERERFVEQNAAAVREQLPADLVFANHVLLGAPVGAASGARYAVKAHGSELEYSMRGNAELGAWGRESLTGASAVFVGSEHIREVLEEVVGHVDGVHEVPPGVDVDLFRPEPREQAIDRLLDAANEDPPNRDNANERLPDDENALRFEAFFADDVPTVLYFGKLIRNKGVHLLLEALRELDARAVIVGFGDYREELERLARERLAPSQTLFTGPLEHRHLVHLLPLTDATVVPSIFPEAFGMVAAEAAAAGSPPLVARHSGLEEIAEGLEADYPPEYRHLTSFVSGDVADLTAKLGELLELPRKEHHRIAAAARSAVEERWSWSSVASRLLQPFN